MHWPCHMGTLLPECIPAGIVFLQCPRACARSPLRLLRALHPCLGSLCSPANATPAGYLRCAQDVLLQRAHPAKVVAIAFSKSEGHGSIPLRQLALKHQQMMHFARVAIGGAPSSSKVRGQRSPTGAKA